MFSILNILLNMDIKMPCGFPQGIKDCLITNKCSYFIGICHIVMLAPTDTQRGSDGP